MPTSLVSTGVQFPDSTTQTTAGVTPSGSATLTNKTISGANNTLTNISLSSSVTGTLPVANGGTGATTLTANNVLLGNGTSALQVVAPGSSGNVLMSNGTTWTSAAASSGALTLLQTVTASSSATVDLTTSIGSTYDFYLITFTNVTSSAGGTFSARMQIGGSYSTSSYNAMSNAGYSNGSGNLALNESSVNAISLNVDNLSTTAGASISGELWFSNPTNTSNYKIINFVTGNVNVNSARIATTQGTGTNLSSLSALTGIRFFLTGGNIATGVFRLYGLANS